MYRHVSAASSGRGRDNYDRGRCDRSEYCRLNRHTSSSGTTIGASNGAKLALKGFEIRAASGMRIGPSAGGSISFSGYMRVGACSAHQIRALNLGTFLANNLAYDIVGGGLMHVNASLSGLLNLAGSTVRIPTGVTVAFSSAVVQAD